MRWTPISNRDPVTYYVHLGTSSDFVPDYSQNSTTLQGTTFGSTFSIARLKDGTDLDISGATTYYAKIIPWDADGFGPVGAVGSGKPSRVTTTYIEPFTIQADNVADFVLAATKFNTSTHMIF